MDVAPRVGDRAMATLGLMGTIDSKYGTLRHLLMHPKLQATWEGRLLLGGQGV